MRFLLLTFLLLPIMSFAQGETLTVGEQTVQYDSTFEGETATLYYQGETLVASEHERVTIVYENDQAVLEAHDTDGDGTLDTFAALNTQAEITEVTGPGAEFFERPETVEFRDALPTEEATDEDLVGSLESIDIPKSGNSTLLIIILVLLGGGGYLVIKRKRERASDGV